MLEGREDWKTGGISKQGVFTPVMEELSPGDAMLLAAESTIRSLDFSRCKKVSAESICILTTSHALEEIKSLPEDGMGAAGRVALHDWQKNRFEAGKTATINGAAYSDRCNLASIATDRETLLILQCLKEDGWKIQLYPNPDEEMCVVAVTAHPFAIQTLNEKQQTKAVQLAALENDHRAFPYIVTPCEEAQLFAVERAPDLIDSIGNPSEEVQQRAALAKSDLANDILAKLGIAQSVHGRTQS